MNSIIMWEYIDWHCVQSHIAKYQRSIYIASSEKNIKKTKVLQKEFINHLNTRLFAVRHVTTRKKTFPSYLLFSQKLQQDRLKKVKTQKPYENGLNNNTKQSLTDFEKVLLAQNLHIDGKINLIKRVLTSKKNKNTKRSTPLKISSIEDQAKQFIVLLALEPQWEAMFKLNPFNIFSYNYQDATLTVFENLKVQINQQNQNLYILKIVIQDFFKSINHSYLLNKLNTVPEIEKQIKIWLDSDIINSHLSYPLKTNINSKLFIFLISVTLQGIEAPLQLDLNFNNFMKPKVKKNMICYANSLVIFHTNQTVLLNFKYKIEQWLNQTSNLTLNKEKTKIFSANEGFDFLGFRFINVKKNGKIRNKFYPNKKSIKNITLIIGNILRTNRAISSYDLITKLRPIIVDWCHYYCISQCRQSFSKLNHINYQMLRAWVFRRDKRHGKSTVKEKYFPSRQYYHFQGRVYQDNWVLNGTKKLPNGYVKKIFLPKFTWIEKNG